MESGLYKKYIGSPCKKNGIDTFQADFNKLQAINETKDVELKTVKTTRHMMPDGYEEGDSVDEDDFEDSFKAKGKFPQLSVQDYSSIKKDKKGNNYVTKLKEN